MARVARAAITLAEQVQAERRSAKWEVVGEPDGLGVQRSIRFKGRTGDWLAALLETMDDDRIESFEKDKDGLVVTITGRPRGDYRDPFPLEDAALVASQ